MRKNMFIAGVIALASSLCAAEFTITLPPEPKPWERTAAAELQHYLALRVESLEVAGVPVTAFAVGDTERARELAPGLESEEWAVIADGDRIVINGGGSRGALYGVYHFLEDRLGIHWWNPFEEYIPPKGPVRLDALQQRGRPFFRHREIFRCSNRSFPADEGRFAARNRLNMDGANPILLRYGGGAPFGSPDFVHTFDSYIPAQEYLSTHPEYFSLGTDGQRHGGQFAGQLCLTNPEVKAKTTRKLFEYISADIATAEADGTAIPTIYDISINDNSYPCRCPECAEVAAKHNESGLLLLFLNDIAGELKDAYPDYRISTLAYYYTEDAPRGVKPTENVLVRLCDTATNQAAGCDAPENRHFTEKLRQWGELGPIYVWDYAVTFIKPGLPFPSEYAYASYFRTFARDNVTGVFLEHEFPQCGDMYDLKLFLEAKLMEDPQADVEQLKTIFMTRYYGPAAPYIVSYREMLRDAALENDAFVGWMARPGSFAYIAVDDLIAMQALFDRAQDALTGEDDALYRTRLERARFGLDRLSWLLWQHYVATWNESGRVRADFPLDRETIFDRATRTFAAATEKLTDHDSLRQTLAEEIATMRTLPDDAAKPAFPGRPDALVFNAGFFAVHGAHFALTADPGSPCGLAARGRVDGNAAKFAFPLNNGVYCDVLRVTQTNRLIGAEENPGNGDYKWYDLGTFDIDPNAFFFITNDWELQLEFAAARFTGKAEIHASVKLTGPAFDSASAATESFFYIDRIALLPVR